MKKLPKSGELRETLLIQRRTRTENDYGEIEVGLSDVVTVYAKIVPLMPVATLAGAVSELDEYSHKAMFYSPNIGIDTNLRAVWRGERYAIKKVVNDPVNRFTTIFIKELGVEEE